MAPPSVPRCRRIVEGTQGVDVVGVKRALCRAGYMAPGTFTKLWGPHAVRATRQFQEEHGIPAGFGMYGERTHAALVQARKEGTDEFAFDAYSIDLMQQLCDELATASVDGRREAIVAEAVRLYLHREEIDYVQVRPFPLELPPSIPAEIDCSAFVTICHFVGGAPDPNGNGYNGWGYTGTLIAHGEECSASELEAGDLVFYGRTTSATLAFPIGSPTHVAIYDGDGGVYSQGGPDRDDRMTHQPTRYRPVNQYRHYDVGE